MGEQLAEQVGATECRVESPRQCFRGEVTKVKILYCVAVFFLLLPFLLVSLLGVPVWIGRAMAVSIFIIFGTIGIFWFGLSSKSKMIREGGKFNEPQYDESRPQIEKGIRILVVAFGIFFLFYATFPVGSDLIHLAGGESIVSLILKEKRQLNRQQMEKLSHRFHVSPAVFF